MRHRHDEVRNRGEELSREGADIGNVFHDLEAETEIEGLAEVELEEISLPRLDRRRAVGSIEVDRDFSGDPVEPLEVGTVVGADVDDAPRVPTNDPRQEEHVLQIERVGAPAPIGAALPVGVRL